MASIAAGMKRKGGGEDGGAAQSALKRCLTKHMPFQESESIRERAKPYLLAVGKLHVDVMDIIWSTSRNRCVKPGHVWELTEVFMKGGLKRGALENCLFFIRSSGEQMVVILLPKTIAIATAKQTSSTSPLLIRPRWRSWRDSTSFTPSDSTSRQQARWSLMPGGRVSYTTKCRSHQWQQGLSQGAKLPLTIGLLRLSISAARRVFLHTSSSRFGTTKGGGK
ncbi:hypothetical protein RB213_001798 [Colletotrichum asianum]